MSTSDAPYEYISTQNAFVAANVPLSQAIKVPATSHIVFLSGCIGAALPDGAIVPGGVEAQTLQVCQNLLAVAEAAGADKAGIVKCNIYLKDMNDFGAVNKVYGAFFAPHKPARTCVEVARLPMDVLVEIEGIAVVRA